MKSLHRRHRGFTLVEVMVTLSIIIVLSIVGFAGYKSVRASADSAVSMSRLRTLALANAAYAADHNSRYVPIFAFDERGRSGVHWIYNPEFFEGIVDNLEFLEDPEEHEGKDGYPENVLDPVVVRAKKKYSTRISGSYGYNWENTPGGSWNQKGTAPRHSMKTMKSPSRTFMFITATDWLAKYEGRYLWKRTPEEGKTPDGKIAYRHKGKALVAYYDGHTGAISPDDMKEFDRRGGINNVFWGGRRR